MSRNKDECRECGGQLIVSGIGQWSRTVCDSCGDERPNIVERERQDGDELLDFAVGNGWE